MSNFFRLRTLWYLGPFFYFRRHPQPLIILNLSKMRLGTYFMTPYLDPVQSFTAFQFGKLPLEYHKGNIPLETISEAFLTQSEYITEFDVDFIVDCRNKIKNFQNPWNLEPLPLSQSRYRVVKWIYQNKTKKYVSYDSTTKISARSVHRCSRTEQKS